MDRPKLDEICFLMSFQLVDSLGLMGEKSSSGIFDDPDVFDCMLRDILQKQKHFKIIHIKRVFILLWIRWSVQWVEHSERYSQAHTEQAH